MPVPVLSTAKSGVDEGNSPINIYGINIMVSYIVLTDNAEREAR